MILELLANVGAPLPAVIALLVVMGAVLAVQGGLLGVLFKKPTRKSAPARSASPADETAPEPASEPVDDTVEPASEPAPETVEPASEPVDETVDEPTDDASEESDAASCHSERSEAEPKNLPEDATPSDPEEPVDEPIPIEELLGESDDESDDESEEEPAPAEEPEEEPVEESVSEEEPVEESVSEEAPEEGTAGEPEAAPEESSEESSEESPEESPDTPVESTAETVEEILEEHGLESVDEITAEIAEEIMAVHTHHDGEEVEVVRVEGLSKKYSKKADYAVRDVNFRCYEGEIVGLLGHNGAGKSTTLKCLEGMLPFEKGEISICGHDIRKDSIAAKANMGFVTDNHATFVKMTGMQYLAFMADVYKVPTEVRKERVEKLEEIFRLGPAIDNLISSYSHGMRQKICMMGSLMHMPKLWVLDEPMTGLDPRTMHAVQGFMREYANAGNCIIFSSHALITVAKMCDRVVLLRTGNQLDDLNIKRIMTVDPNFDFEEYFLQHEGQD